MNVKTSSNFILMKSGILKGCLEALSLKKLLKYENILRNLILCSKLSKAFPIMDEKGF